MVGIASDQGINVSNAASSVKSINGNSVHGLRHTHCTLGLQSRAYSVEEMMHRLGHSDVRVTMQVYTHVTEETMENNPEAYKNYFHTLKR